MKRSFFLCKCFLLMILCWSSSANAQTFTLNNWYALSSYTVTAADDCGTVFRVDARFNAWAPSQFEILCDGKPLGKSELQSFSSSVYFEGSGDAPAWRVARDNSGENWSQTFYISIRETPYVIYDEIPEGAFDVAKVVSYTPNKGIVTSPTETIELNGMVCSSVDTATFTYQWVSSKDGEIWTAIAGATSQTLSTQLKSDSTYYALTAKVYYDEVNGTDTTYNVAHDVESAPVFFRYKTVGLTFEAEKGVGAKEFNAKEFEVNDGGKMLFTASSSDFDGAPTYILQYRPLEGTKEDLTWKDFSSQKAENMSMEITPTVSAEYRVMVTGKSKYSGQEVTAYSSNLVVVRKIYSFDTENFSFDVLWKDDFGEFQSATKYVDSEGAVYDRTFEMTDGRTATIENYWAPDPFNYVKEHDYAAFDPNFINNNRDWCSKYRLEDGYYIITSNPYKGDGKNNYADRDYWEAEDHTVGDTNGGMLFVNCKGALEGVMIYERDITLNCSLNGNAAIWVYFSAFVNNAVYKQGSDTPVNVRMEILDSKKNVIYSVASGDVNQRKGSLSADSWAHLSFKFIAKEQNYTIRLYNNAPGGANWGNDILLDDIAVTLCYPKVKLMAKDSEKDEILACKDEKFELIAFNEQGLSNFINEPKFQFQYKNESTGQKWTNLGGIIPDSNIVVTATEDLLGVTKYRVIVAADVEVVKSICDGKTMELNCATVYAIDSAMVSRISQPFDLEIALSTNAICLGEGDVEASAVPVQKGISPTNYYWYLNDELVDSTETNTFIYSKEDEGALFPSVNEYYLEVRAIDDVCQKNFEGKEWAPTNKDTLEVFEHKHLGLEVSKKDLSWGESMTFTIDLDGYEGDSLLWNENGGVENEFMTESLTSYRMEPGQNGNVAYYVQAPKGVSCVDPSDTVWVNVNLIIPNLVTPFNDGLEALNNTFLLGKGFHVEIFNRYQQLIYEGEDGWDCQYKGQTAEPGTYYYRVFLPNGEIRKGTLEVAKFKK